MISLSANEGGVTSETWGNVQDPSFLDTAMSLYSNKSVHCVDCVESYQNRKQTYFAKHLILSHFITKIVWIKLLLHKTNMSNTKWPPAAILKLRLHSIGVHASLHPILIKSTKFSQLYVYWKSFVYVTRVLNWWTNGQTKGNSSFDFALSHGCRLNFYVPSVGNLVGNGR